MSPSKAAARINSTNKRQTVARHARTPGLSGSSLTFLAAFRAFHASSDSRRPMNCPKLLSFRVLNARDSASWSICSAASEIYAVSSIRRLYENRCLLIGGDDGDPETAAQVHGSAAQQPLPSQLPTAIEGPSKVRVFKYIPKRVSAKSRT